MTDKANKHYFDLGLRELLSVICIVVLIVFIIFPFSWKQLEKVKESENGRFAYRLRDDYWAYYRYLESVTCRGQVPFIGDSVIWGQYTDNTNTLVFKLNEGRQGVPVANAAIDGLHSVALPELLRKIGSLLKERKLILYYNPLWMNSLKYDLQDKEEFAIHHPRLLPQFDPSLRCYRETVSGRISILLSERLDFFSLRDHLRLYYFDNMGLSEWIIEYPWSLPFGHIRLKIDVLEQKKRNDDRSWQQRRLNPQDWQWLRPDRSRQWQYFIKSLDILNDNNTDVFVVIGNINPYIMTEASYIQFIKMKKELADILTERGQIYLEMPVLESEEYADASHPTRHGYRSLGVAMLDEPLFADWLP